MSQKKVLYVGAGGEHFVASEFLINGWNIASPEVDVGTDTFVVDDLTGAGVSCRIQIKTTFAKQKKKGFSFGINLKSTHLMSPTSQKMFYAFPVRLADNTGWLGIFYIFQDDLLRLIGKYKTVIAGVNLRVLFTIADDRTTIFYKKENVSHCWNRKGFSTNWKTLSH